MSTKTLARLPSPGPSSTKLKFFGFPNFSHVETIHIPIISENKLEIVGAVTKSPFGIEDKNLTPNNMFHTECTLAPVSTFLRQYMVALTRLREALCARVQTALRHWEAIREYQSVQSVTLDTPYETC